MADQVVMYLPDGQPWDITRWRRECAVLCRRMRWLVVAVTSDPGTARRLVADGQADRVVVARPAHERAVRVPTAVASDPPGRRRDRSRPRRLTPPAAG